jgi:arsenate reductase
MYGDRYEAHSVGVLATSVDPHDVRAMLEIVIDISAQRSKSSQEFRDTIFDLAVTVCDQAKQACPICFTQLKLPSKSPKAREVKHKRFENPAAVLGSEEEQLDAFRTIRDEIKDWISRTSGDDARLSNQKNLKKLHDRDGLQPGRGGRLLRGRGLSLRYRRLHPPGPFL